MSPNWQRGKTFEMRLVLVMCTLGRMSVAQLTSTPLGSTGTTPAHTDNDTTHKPWGADYLPMEGGTEVKMPFPQAVPIKQDGEMSAGDPEYPCFGTMKGDNVRQKRLLLTSVYCNVEGHIDKKYTNWGYEDIEITRLIGPIRKKRQAVVPLTYPFSVITYGFPYYNRLNETAFGAPGELISDVQEYQRIISNPRSKGIVLASRPYKAGAVSLDQANCGDVVYKVRREPDMPENLTKGVFCVFMGNDSIKHNGEDIAPGLPCRDSLGSPVLVEGPSGYSRVLGIVIMYLCQWLPPEWSNYSKTALATSVAYAFNYTSLPLPPLRPTSYLCDPDVADMDNKKDCIYHFKRNARTEIRISFADFQHTAISVHPVYMGFHGNT